MTDVLDPRQRRAAALLLPAVRLPAEMRACSRQYLLAARVLPGATVQDLRLGDHRGALIEARDLIDQMLADEAAA